MPTQFYFIFIRLWSRFKKEAEKQSKGPYKHQIILLEICKNPDNQKFFSPQL